MSRIGNAHIQIPAGVTVEIKNNNITVKGAKGTLALDIDSLITAKVENNEIIFTRANDLSDTKAKHGLYRALCANMVKGVTEGFKKTLIVNGVGWKVAKQGKKVVMNIGFSHPVEVEEIEGVTMECPSQTEIVVSGIDKEKVGQFAAMIRGIKPVEPYHAYGIRYKEEVVTLKVGKRTGK